MYYRIAGITFCSQLALPTYEAFACAPTEPDVTLETGGEAPRGGGDVETGAFVCRDTGDGWFYHLRGDEETGLMVSRDYTRLRLIRRREGPPGGQEDCFIRTALECLLIRRGYVSLHAACIECDGAAIAFTGDSGVGKSTRAKAWQKAAVSATSGVSAAATSSIRATRFRMAMWPLMSSIWCWASSSILPARIFATFASWARASAACSF